MIARKHAKYLLERKKMMQEYADYLESTLSMGNAK